MKINIINHEKNNDINYMFQCIINNILLILSLFNDLLSLIRFSNFSKKLKIKFIKNSKR